jgi:hypothetical protein
MEEFFAQSVRRGRKYRVFLFGASIAAFSYVSSVLAIPAPPNAATFLKAVPCASAVMNTLSKWSATDEWFREPLAAGEGSAMNGPTTKIGTWVELEVDRDGTVSAVRRSPETTVKIHWQKNCLPEAKVAATDISRPGTFPVLTDANLESALKNGTSGIIYAWSPHMPLSVKGFPEAQALARKLKIKFIPVLDPVADESAARAAIKKYNFPSAALRKNVSIELQSRLMGIHYPSTIVFSKHRFSALNPGLWDNLPVYEKFVQENLR